MQRVRIDLARTFEKGQAYVGLSRATSLETLQVLNFDPTRCADARVMLGASCLMFALHVHRVIAHPAVIAWHEGNLRQELQHQAFEDEMDAEEAVRSYFQSRG